MTDDARLDPPRLARALLWLVLPPHYREQALDDLTEEYRAIARQRVRWRAHAWYWQETCRSLPTAIVERASGRGRRPAARVARTRRVHDGVLHELRLAVRRQSHAPGFFAAAALTLAIGLGAAIAIITLLHAVVLRALPYDEADRLVAVRHSAVGLGLTELHLSEPIYDHYRTGNRTFEQLGLYSAASVNVSGVTTPELVNATLATPSLMAALRASAAIGRVLTDGDIAPGSPLVVVLSHRYWVSHFGGDASVLGRTLLVNGVPREIVGVASADFVFPTPETSLWLAMRLDSSSARIADLYLRSIGRLRPGISTDAAERDLQRLIATLPEAYPNAAPALFEKSQLRALVKPLQAEVIGDIGTTLWLLFTSVALVLLVACANVANLVLVRTEHRRQEVAVRVALGATRADLVRYFASESIVLAGTAGIVGSALAHWSIRLLVRAMPFPIPRLHEVRVDPLHLACGLGLTLICTVLLALAPLRRRSEPTSTMLAAASRGSIGAVDRRMTRLLVVSQLALAFVLVAGSSLMFRSVWHILHVDTGVAAPERVLTMDVILGSRAYREYAPAAAFFERLLTGVRELPGVRAAGGVSSLPLAGTPFTSLSGTVDIAGRDLDSDQPAPTIEFRLVTPGYFQAMGIPVIAGRDIAVGEVVGSERPVVLSAAAARRLFGTSLGLNERIRRTRRDGQAARPWTTVVGVAGDVRDRAITADPTPIVYVPILAAPVDDGYVPRGVSLAIRTSTEPTTLVEAVRTVVREIDGAQPIANVRTMSDIVVHSTARMTFTTTLVGIAAMTALLLGAVGVYATIAFWTARRTREIGLRVALGARRADVHWMVVRQGAALAVVGLMCGVAVWLGLAPVFDDLTFGVAPNDVQTYAVSLTVLASVAVAAAWIPASRAARVDPVTTLRAE